jgi:hypothetical protein
MSKKKATKTAPTELDDLGPDDPTPDPTPDPEPPPAGLDFATEIDKVCGAIKKLCDAGLGGEKAADAALEVYSYCSPAPPGSTRNVAS